MRQRITLGGWQGDYQSRKARNTAINCYIEASDDGSFARIRKATGLNDFFTFGNGPVRGLHVANDVLYAVAGSEFWRIVITPVGAVAGEKKGDVAGFSGPIRISSIGTDEPQVMALTNTRGFIYKNSDDTFAEVTDLDFDPDFSVTSFNQRFWFNKPNSNEFFASDILDGFSYDPLFFASAENDSDPLEYVQALNTQLFLMGSRSIEAWQDTGASTGFPLRRITGATLNRGIGAQASVANFENSIFFLADDFTVRRVGVGSAPEKISDLDFELEVQDYQFPERAFGYFVDTPVQKIYYLNFPGDDATWGYDTTTGKWHKRSTVDTNGWLAADAALIFDRTIIGDKRISTDNQGKLYVADKDTYEEAGEDIEMSWRASPISVPESPFTVSRLELVSEVGVGLIDDVNTIDVKEPDTLDPRIRLRVSKDGGYTWDEFPTRSLGRIGEYQHKVIWRNIGRVKRTNDLIFEFLVNEKVKVEAYSAYIDIEVGI